MYLVYNMGTQTSRYTTVNTNAHIVEEYEDGQQVTAFQTQHPHPHMFGHPKPHLRHKVHSAIKNLFSKTQFSAVGIAQILLLIMTVILSVVFYTRHSSSDNNTLLIQAWEVTLDPCTPSDAKCVTTQQGSAPPMLQRLNCSASSFRTASESSLSSAVGKEQFMDSTTGLNGASSLCLLSGISYAYDHASTEAFSTLDIVFFCMSSQVLSSCIALLYIVPMTADNRHKNYFNISLVMMGLYGMCVFFFQNLWLIPMNNVLIVEFLLVSTIIGTWMYSKSDHHTSKESKSDHTHTYDPADAMILIRLVDIATTLPLLSTAIMAVVGVNATLALTITGISIGIAPVIFIASKMPHIDHSHDDDDFMDTHRHLYIYWKDIIFTVTAWLAVTPAIINMVIAFYNTRLFVDNGYNQRPWAIASMGFTLMYVIVFMAVQSVRWTDKQYAINIMDISTLLIRYAIVLCIFVGALAALDG